MTRAGARRFRLSPTLPRTPGIMCVHDGERESEQECVCALVMCMPTNLMRQEQQVLT